MAVNGAPSSGTGPEDQRSLHEQQALLVRCLGKLIAYAYERGYQLTLGEGFVLSPRKTRAGDWVQDGMHMPSSLHYVGLAQDMNLFCNGEYITHSDHFAWIDLAGFWEALDPACCSGVHFGDANHFSVTFGGRK